MKNITAIGLLFGFSLILTQAHGQVQLMEQGTGGLMPILGTTLTPDVIQGYAGVEYNIEGKACLGATYAATLKDTLFQADGSKVLPAEVNPFLSIEFVEPDRVFPISFAIDGGYVYTSGKEKDSPHEIKQEFKQHRFYGGPALGIRFFIGHTGLIVPTVGYQFNWVDYAQIDTLLSNQLVGGAYRDVAYPIRSADTEMWHDIIASCPFSYMFTEIVGLGATPELRVRVGRKEGVEVVGGLRMGLLLKI